MSLGRPYAAALAKCVMCDSSWRAKIFMKASSSLRWSLEFQFHVLIGCREWVARDVTDRRVGHSWPHAVQVTDLPDGREDGLLMHELLDTFEDCPAPLRVQFGSLLTEERVDIGITAVDKRTAGSHERLDPCSGIAKGASAPLDKIPVLLVRVPLGKCRPLKGSECCADADCSEVSEHALPEAGEPGIREVFAGLEAVRVSGLVQEALRAGWIVRVCRWRPVEFERGGDDAAGDPREAQCLCFIDRLSVYRLICGHAHAPVVPRRLRIPLVGEVDPEGSLNHNTPKR